MSETCEICGLPKGTDFDNSRPAAAFCWREMVVLGAAGNGSARNCYRLGYERARILLFECRRWIAARSVPARRIGDELLARIDAALTPNQPRPRDDAMRET